MDRFVMRTLLSVISILLFANNLASAQNGGIAGQAAPKWKVEKWYQLPEGKKSLSPADYKGKVLYLYFFQSWCPGCHKTGFPTLVKVKEKFANNPNVEFVVIQTAFEGHTINKASKLSETAKRYGLDIPFGQSTGSFILPEIMRKYKSRGTPWTVIIDPSGVVQYNNFYIKPDQAIGLIEKLQE